MIKIRLFLSAILLSLFLSCSITKQQKAGEVNPINFHQKTAFTLNKSLILIPVTINSEPKNFFFDTGAQLTVIQSDSLFGKIRTVTGASGKELNMGLDKVKNIKIGDTEFVNTYALNQDLKELKEKIPDFGGIIGQSVIQKANWLIDYPNKKIEFSSNNLSDEGFTKIEIERKDGSPFTFMTINDRKYRAIIDLGASSALSIPQNSNLAEDLLKMHEF
ncbi:MAG: aspartyl protease family protein [Croceivirga sp.]